MLDILKYMKYGFYTPQNLYLADKYVIIFQTYLDIYWFNLISFTIYLALFITLLQQDSNLYKLITQHFTISSVLFICNTVHT